MKSAHFQAEMIAIAQHFTKALEARDIDELANIYAADALIWHNTDCVTLTVPEHLSSFRRNTAMIPRLRYMDVRTIPFEEGFVQQHRATGDIEGGTALDIPCCIVCHVKEGKITRLEEYYDSGTLARAGLSTSHEAAVD